MTYTTCLLQESCNFLFVICLCRVTSNSDAGALGNISVDFPGPPQPTFPAPPAKRPYRGLFDTLLTSNPQLMKTKPRSAVSPAVDQNVNDIAAHGCSINLDPASRSSAVLQSVSDDQEKSHHQCETGENARQLRVNDPSSALLTDCGMRVLWSGQVAVNGTELCSAELVSRCQIRHTL